MQNPSILILVIEPDQKILYNTKVRAYQNNFFEIRSFAAGHRSYIFESCVHPFMISNIMKCKCGTRDIIKAKSNVTVEHFMLDKKCPRCGTVGAWRQLSQDEYMWEKAKS